MTAAEAGETTDRIALLVARCERFDEPARGEALDLLRLVLELHGAALRRMIAPATSACLAAWQRDPEIAGILELHNIALPAPPPPARPDFVPLATLAR